MITKFPTLFIFTGLNLGYLFVLTLILLLIIIAGLITLSVWKKFSVIPYPESINNKERKSSEEASSDNEKRFRSLYENFMIGIYRTTPDGKILMANPALVKMLGFNSFKDLSSRNLDKDDYSPTYNRSQFIEKIEKEGKVVGFEAKWKRKDGSYVYVHENAQAVRDANGKTLYYDGIVEDVTERKITEESLILFRTLINQSSDSIEITDPHTGRFLDANEIAWKSLGYTREELLSKTVFDIDPGIDKVSFFNPDSMLKKTGFMIVKGYHYRKDGTKFPVEVNLRYINLERDYVVAVSRDVSQQEKALEEINKLSKAVEQSPVSIIIADTKGNMVYVNPKLCKLTGYTKEEILGKNPRIFKSGYTSPEEYKNMWEKISSGKEWKGELCDKMKNGTFIWESVTISAIKNSTGKITHYLAVKEDITERKKYEDELRAAKVKAENANRAKDLFLANMSHELRTPLIGILGYSEMLMESLGNTENGGMAKGIKRSGKRLLNTLNLLLNLTRIESEKFEISITGKNIIEELQFVFTMFKGAALEKNLDYSLIIQEDNLTAKVDSGLLTVILENLINNALKFTNKGCIEVTAGKQSDGKIFIKVKDTGIGIDKKHFDKIFEEFSQVSEGINREFQGTGLGLAISKKYVEILNGTIIVDSKLGEGSTFIIILPA